MTSIKLIVNGAEARAEVDGILTAGMVGIPVTIVCDSTWNGLTKNLVCRRGEAQGPYSTNARTIPDVASAATVAHEVMMAGMELYLGLEGYNADGTLVIPTTWANCGEILPGATSDSDYSVNPTLPVWVRLRTELDLLPETIEAALRKAEDRWQASMDLDYARTDWVSDQIRLAVNATWEASY